jgi:putative holliday junction resolvase
LTRERLLGIDYGKKRIGLALSDPLMIFAYAYETISNDYNVIQNLSKIISEKEVTKIILGYPLKESGEDTHSTKDVLLFKKELENRLHIEVLLYDERYSSSIAQEKMIDSVTKKSKRKDKSLIDKGAAAVILQDYMDSIK